MTKYNIGDIVKLKNSNITGRITGLDGYNPNNIYIHWEFNHSTQLQSRKFLDEECIIINPMFFPCIIVE